MIVEFTREKGALVAKGNGKTYRPEPYVLQEFSEGEKAPIAFWADEVSESSMNDRLELYAKDLEYYEHQDLVRALIREHLRWSNSTESLPSDKKDMCSPSLFDEHMKRRGFGADLAEGVLGSELKDFNRMLEEACKDADEWWEKNIANFLLG